MTLKKLTLAAVFLCSLFSLSAFGKSDEAEVQTVQVEGIVSFYGNEPFSYPGLKTKDGLQYTLVTEDKAMEKKIRKASGRKILVTGTINLPEDSETTAYFQMLKDGYFMVEDFEVVKPKKNK